MKHKKTKWPKDLVQEIEAAYINEYRKWSDTTNRPSLIGTRNDLYRLQMLVMDSFAEKYPEVDFYYKEIISKFDDIDLSKKYPGKVVTKLTSQKETLEMAGYFSRHNMSFTETILSVISAIIFYGVGIGMLLYILIKLI